MKRLFSILIVVIFLAGNIGLTLSTHYCGGHVSEQSLGLSYADLGCGMEDESEDNCSGEETSVKSNCCSDDHKNFKIADEFKIQTELISIDTQFATLFFASFFDLYSIESENYTQYLNYQPPRLTIDIPVLIQSFLI